MFDDIYEQTALTPLKVAKNSGYRDWAAQPALFKHYPDFLYRIPFGVCKPLLHVERVRFISAESIIGTKPYFRLNVPSAGNLHPVELYVQIRGIKGVLSGIYHVDALAKEFVLIQEVAKEGLESHVGLKQNLQGFLYIVTCVPFRSAWKYGLRAFRYCYLDVGHQVGGIEAVLAEEQSVTILSDFNTAKLNHYMGFSDEEQCCAVVAVGEKRDLGSKPLKAPLMRVAPCDYFEDIEGLASLFGQQDCFYGNGTRVLHVRDREIKERRSARAFVKNSMSQDSLRYFMQRLSHPPKPLQSNLIVLDDRFMKRGIYGDEVLLREGDFTQEISDLLVDQKFLQKASLIMVLSAKRFMPEYLMQGGLFAHELYLEATKKGCGFTAIGAFYDTKLQIFLSIQRPILYVCAVAKEKK